MQGASPNETWVEQPPAPVRRLGPADEAALLAATAGDHGHALFIASNALSYGLGSDDPRYWAQVRGDGTIEAVLMRAAHNGNLYALPGVVPQPLIDLALREPFAFIMGTAATMALIEARAPRRLRRVEVHCFADLPQQRFTPPLRVVPSDVTVRRGHPTDVDLLARLYHHSEGFEGLSYHQVRLIMLSRLTHLRTHLAEREGQAIAAAATTAETATGAMIGGVWTSPGLRGQGLAGAVVASLARELLRERRRPHLFYREANDAAAHVYAALGFRITSSWRILYFER